MHTHPPSRWRRRLEKIAEEALQVRAARRSHQEAKTKSTPQKRNGSFGWAEHRHLIRLRQTADCGQPVGSGGGQRMSGANQRPGMGLGEGHISA